MSLFDANIMSSFLILYFLNKLSVNSVSSTHEKIKTVILFLINNVNYNTNAEEK